MSSPASSLVEIDSLEILVIIDNELDPISPVPPDTVHQTGGSIGQIASSTACQLDPNERGDAAVELRMDNICCAAHGLSIMVVGRIRQVPELLFGTSD
jgi:7,8-dihydropterin-6-yl-methyl-4-(beta-D-ribofuranosyl)aminobenzene 5'-phosphate synthase